MYLMFSQLKNKLKKNDGMEVLQVLLISGIALVLIVVVFYPALQEFFGAILKAITEWFENKGSEPFK